MLLFTPTMCHKPLLIITNHTLSRAFTLIGECCSSISTTSVCPLPALMCRGVQPAYTHVGTRKTFTVKTKVSVRYPLGVSIHVYELKVSVVVMETFDIYFLNCIYRKTGTFCSNFVIRMCFRQAVKTCTKNTFKSASHNLN